MNPMLTLIPGYLFITLIIIGSTAHSNSYAVNKTNSVESAEWSYPEYGKGSTHNTGRRSEKLDLQHYNRETERNVTLKRGVKNYQKQGDKMTRNKLKYKPSGARRKNVSPNYADESTESRHYHTFEEIHEHIDEDDGQYQASEQVGTQAILHEHVEHSSKKDAKRMKVKIKHHHHHHHHNHIKELIKTVPQPYPVEKVVHVPIEKIVEKIVHVPKLVNVTVEKIVHVPIEKIVEKVIHIPKPVQVPKPYVVEKIIEKIVHVPKPYPVLRTVPYPVEIKVPVHLEKKVPVPYKVEVERKVPVYIRSSEPYKFESSSLYESYPRGEEFKFNMEMDHPPPREHEPSSLPSSNYYNRIYKSRELDHPPRMEDYQSSVPTQLKHDYATKTNLDQQFKNEYVTKSSIDPQFKHDYVTKSSIDPQFKHDYVTKSSIDPQFKHDYVTKSSFDSQYNQEYVPKTSIESTSPGRDGVSLKLVGPPTPFNITGKDLETANSAPDFVNSSNVDLSPQESANAYRGMPFSIPFQFVQLQPMAFQSPIHVELPIQSASAEGAQK
uniref:Uncharacterized protein, isoform B n=1 Tax=Drosophila melanogaster TaxID=7227 RepID=Q9VL03_DROME|nr:uncharacterized protein Dmel_CG13138, isoform B [Drosophila melanogaster]NP_723559.2 uncharacterized protein Dmel_CG13138, isoform C [Drosophila melanogaster]AAF52902.2 uncharacterized protein Dmel_CG13138, isoform C [Drosophila melanogaster]AAN10742.1 uncharacterized protein Dmel_CG13138, isoform B [Drosophila melanogaster]|eukprot:NP_609372.1 uncharacterized protein Dmel_CG13138, isoform B [Drosophila melanogaster]